MRLYLRTTRNTQPVPFDYQRKLVGAFHKWLGHNSKHDTISLYSLSWLQGGRKRGSGLEFENGAEWFVSAIDPELLQDLIRGIQQDARLAFGMKVREVQIQPEPAFTEGGRFWVQSPVLVKRNEENGRSKFYLYTDEKADVLLTETLRSKLEKANLSHLQLTAAFDRSYPQARTKLVDYNGIKIKGNLCPVILTGDPQALAFAWNVGVGNSTGIGFGALK